LKTDTLAAELQIVTLCRVDSPWSLLRRELQVLEENLALSLPPLLLLSSISRSQVGFKPPGAKAELAASFE
jgi:hypothetical protein